MKTKGFRKALAAALVLAVSGCTSTRQIADVQFKPPEGNYKLIVMQPDISVGVLTAGGAVEPHAEWTEKARANVLKALATQQSGRGGETRIAVTREEAGADPTLVADLVTLHSAVGRSIQIHKYMGQNLPTKKDQFDWTLGEQAVKFGAATQYDYALFMNAQDTFSSGGRVALQAAGFLTCMLGVCIVPSGGQQYAFVSLVDLKTGKVVWFNALSSSVGDIRSPEGAEKMVKQLLDQMKSGKALQARAGS